MQQSYFSCKSLFSDKVTEFRTQAGDLIGFVEEVAKDNFKATNFLKLTSVNYDFLTAKYFVLSSFNNKPNAQTKISKSQIQLFN